MKKILMILTLACAALLLTQCKKGIVEQPNVTPFGETIEVSLNVENGNSKATINGTTISWEVGDKLYVVGETDGYLGYISAQNSGTTAYFTGTINKGTTAQYFHYYFFGDKTVAEVEENLNNSYYYTYDISNQTGSITNIADNLLLMHGKSSETIASGQTDLKNITMRSMISIVKLQFGVASGTLGDKVICTGGYSGVNFNIKTGSLERDGSSTPYRRYKKSVNLSEVTSSDYYMVVLPGVQTLEFSQGLIGLSCPGPDGGFQANMLYNESNPKSIVLGEMTYLPAIFTVNNGADGEQGTDDDTQVKFSKGNLQYIGNVTSSNNPYWKFADHQYDYLGGTTGSGQGSDASNVDRDLFGWGCTGQQDTRKNDHQNWYQTNYQPYSTKKIKVNIDHNYYGYGPDYISTPYYNLTVINRSDWGYNPVYYGSDLTTGWHTPTDAECSYLLGRMLTVKTVNENNVSRASYGVGKVNGVKGLIILPDNWDGSKCLNFKYGDDSNFTNEFTELTETKWSAMESAGTVFLPAAGYRDETGLTNVGKTCHYWSSSVFSSSNANYLYVYNGGVTPVKQGSRYCGYSVRLVRDVVDANANANPFSPEPWE